MKTALIVANWKANLTLKETSEWLKRAMPHLKTETAANIVICPSFVSLPSVFQQLQGTHLFTGAQNVSLFPPGKYTGEVTAEMLKDLVRFCIVGHSERRKYYHETNQMISEKARLLLQNKIKPIICVENEKDIEELSDLIKSREIVIAYEPTFAIGTGTPDTPENADKMAQVTHKYFGQSVQVLYGGSVDSRNIASFLRMPNISGALVGGASLNPEEFVTLVKSFS